MTASTQKQTGARPRDPAELRKLILKLRWIGQEQEAEKMHAELKEAAPDQICVEQPLPTD